VKKQIFKTISIIITGIIMFSFFSKPSGLNISANELREKLENNPGIVIDVRTNQEYQQGHLKITDQNLDLLGGEFHDAIEKLDKEKTYYLYCRSGSRSGQAAKMMNNQGFENVFNIGGFNTLVNHGFETE